MSGKISNMAELQSGPKGPSGSGTVSFKVEGDDYVDDDSGSGCGGDDDDDDDGGGGGGGEEEGA
jgi:hypothetical protein